MSNGKRKSTWLVIRRCLAIIRCAQRGPASRDDLIEAMLRVERRRGYSEAVDEEALRRRLEEDLQRIRERLMVDLYYDREADGYVIEDAWMPLLDLPDEDLATIAWLERTFDPRAPKHDEVHGFLRRLRLYLDPGRVAEIEESRTAPGVDLRQRDGDEVRPSVWRGLRKAYLRQLQLELVYLSPQREDGEPLRHVVEPYEPHYFDTTRGHYYLRAYCRRVEGPEGTTYPETYLTYRLGRIQELAVLPRKLPPMAPSAPRYEVEYELAPKVARLGITRHPEIEVDEIERREDGGAVVRGETDDVFWAVRTLLHYGPNCRVLGGPEVRREMRKVVERTAELYGDEG